MEQARQSVLAGAIEPRPPGSLLHAARRTQVAKSKSRHGINSNPVAANGVRRGRRDCGAEGTTRNGQPLERSDQTDVFRFAAAG